MKLLIFGATGRTGRELVKQALESGNEVTAFVRDPAKMDIRHERLRVVRGDITDDASIGNAVLGHDAVLSALGSPGLRKSHELSVGTKSIISAMEGSGVKRLIFESSIGIGDSRDHANLFSKWIFFPLVVKNIFADKEIQERHVRDSSLDWTIVRPGRLTNGRRTGVYRTGGQINEKAVGGSISRADVAEFMLNQLTDNTYVRGTPAVSY
jgi:putative NADH-flavin reductase